MSVQNIYQKGGASQSWVQLLYRCTEDGAVNNWTQKHPDQRWFQSSSWKHAVHTQNSIKPDSRVMFSFQSICQFSQWKLHRNISFLTTTTISLNHCSSFLQSCNSVLVSIILTIIIITCELSLSVLYCIAGSWCTPTPPSTSVTRESLNSFRLFF